MKKESKNNGIYLELTGKVVKGRGEGKFFLSIEGYKKRFNEALGFVPFEGTLNIEIHESELKKKSQLQNPFTISGFQSGERTFAEVYAYPATLDGSDLQCALIIPVRTRNPPNILELISPANLREKLQLKDGSELKVKFWSVKKE